MRIKGIPIDDFPPASKEPVDLTKIEELRQKITTAVNFQEPWDFFFDHLGENDNFLSMGQPTDPGPLRPALQEIGRQLFGVDVIANRTLFIEIPGTDFYHGAVFLNDQLTNLLFFQDSGIGLLSVMMPPDGKITFVRFSTIQIPAEKAITIQSSFSRAIH